MQSTGVLYGKVAINFRVQGKKSTAQFHYKYDPDDEGIDYINIEYTEPVLQTLIENNRKMMENVDNYIRNLLLKERLKQC
jgi:hypothetical protein